MTEQRRGTYPERLTRAGAYLAALLDGYILEERLGIRDPRIEAWKALGQRGSSRKLDPSAPFASTFSETWMISLNA